MTFNYFILLCHVSTGVKWLIKFTRFEIRKRQPFFFWSSSFWQGTPSPLIRPVMPERLWAEWHIETLAGLPISSSGKSNRYLRPRGRRERPDRWPRRWVAPPQPWSSSLHRLVLSMFRRYPQMLFQLISSTARMSSNSPWWCFTSTSSLTKTITIIRRLWLLGKTSLSTMNDSIAKLWREREQFTRNDHNDPEFIFIGLVTSDHRLACLRSM